MLQTRLVVLPLPNLGFTMTVIAATIQRMTPALLFRYRVSLALFLAGLVFSGLTAFPLLVEIRILSGWLGITDPANYQELTGLAHWIAYVNFGLEQTYEKFPFIGYGTDWLAFGHLASAAFFIRPLWSPLDSDWVLKTGLCICAAVIPVAFIAGHIRGIPVYWSMVDSAFGIFGSIPLIYCLHLTRQSRALAE
tara:strand:- start:4331 stop:4909 length:579 start_codon:yes stop_codon:yes gene_type:complete